MISTTALAFTTTSLSIPAIRKVSPKAAKFVQAGMISCGKSLYISKTGIPADDVTKFAKYSGPAVERVIEDIQYYIPILKGYIPKALNFVRAGMTSCGKSLCTASTGIPADVIDDVAISSKPAVEKAIQDITMFFKRNSSPTKSHLGHNEAEKLGTYTDALVKNTKDIKDLEGYQPQETLINQLNSGV